MEPQRFCLSTHVLPCARCCLIVCALCLSLAGCTTQPPPRATPLPANPVEKRLAEILDAAETRDLERLDSYHWYGPHFTKFAPTGSRLDAASAREGEHKGLSAPTNLKLRTADLKIDRFGDTAVATFVMNATIQSGANTVTKRDRGTLVFVRHDDEWKIVHEHFSAAAEPPQSGGGAEGKKE